MESSTPGTGPHEWPQRISPEMRRIVSVVEASPGLGIPPEVIFRELGAISSSSITPEMRERIRKDGFPDETEPIGGLTE